MTPKQEAALRMAREALKESHPEAYRHTITAIDEALAEQQSGIKQVIELYDSPEQPAQQGVDWEKLYRLAVKSKEMLAEKYERDTGKKLTRIVPMTEQPAQQDYWQEEARRYAQNAEFWRGKYEAATAQQQEPVAWMVYTLDGKSVCVTDNPTDFGDQHKALPLYTTPPRREWVGLTDGEIDPMVFKRFNDGKAAAKAKSLAQAIEAKLRELNEHKEKNA